MKEAEVREIIGENKWDAFCEWIKGKPAGTYYGGAIKYYPLEVNRFASLCIAEKI